MAPTPRRPRVRRPRAVAIVLSSILALVLVAGGLAACSLFGAGLDTRGRVDFATPLAIPPLAPSTVTAEGVRVFELEAHAGVSEFVPGGRTPTWGFGSGAARLDYLGPTLRAAVGETVEVRFRNDLDEPTSVHWHGMHLPPAMDGGPHQAVDPGATWSPTWTIDQPAATLWYHPHPHGATEEHIHRGLAGLFLIDDPASPVAADLPHEYGVDDIPLIVQDGDLAPDGGWSHGQDGFTGSLGDTVLVNGTLGPYLDVATESVRLRLLNASGARVYRFALSDGDEFLQIASDGGLLAAPLATDHVQLSPGERAEIVVGLEPGERVVLRSEPQDLGGLLRIFGGDTGVTDHLDIVELRAADALAPSEPIPSALATIDPLDPLQADRERRFELNGTQINGRSMDMGRIDEVVEVDTVEIWDVTNTMAFPHNFHVHDVQFQVLSIAGAPPPPELAGWKDTVYLRPNEEYRLIMRFTDYADPEMPYMFHCHLLRHEDAGMMGQFLVLAPGDPVPTHWRLPGTSPDTEGSDHDH